MAKQGTNIWLKTEQINKNESNISFLSRKYTMKKSRIKLVYNFYTV